MISKRLTLHFAGIFLFSFAFIYVCYVGVPIDFHNDYVTDSLQSLTSVTLPELLLRTLNPLTPGWFYPPLGLMEYMRPLQVLFFHFSHAITPFSGAPFQVAAAVSHGFLGLLLAGMIYRWTRSLLYAWLAVIFHTSFPSNFHIMASIASFDLQYLVSVCDLLMLGLFFALTSGKMRSRGRFAAALVLWFLILWFTIKLKSSEKIIPFICGAHLVWRIRYVHSRLSSKRIAAVFGVLLLSAILVVPFLSFDAWTGEKTDGTAVTLSAKPVTVKDQKFFKFDWTSSLKRAFFVPRENARFPLLTVKSNDQLLSLTENIGFFAGWVFWLGMLMLPFLIFRFRKRAPGNGDADPEDFLHFLSLVLLWFAAIIAGYASGAALKDPRYLNFSYLPFLLLFFGILKMAESAFGLPRLGRRLLQTGVALIVAITVFSNYDILEAEIYQGIGIQAAYVRAEREVFVDFYGREPQGEEFYAGHRIFSNRVMVIDWYALPEDWLDNALQRLSQEGVLYYFCHATDTRRLDQMKAAGLREELLTEQVYLDAAPLIFRVMKINNAIREKMKKKPRRQRIYVYRITRPETEVPKA